MNKSHVIPLIAEFNNLCTELVDDVTFPRISESFLYQIDHSTEKEEYELPIRENQKNVTSSTHKLAMRLSDMP